MLIGIIWTFGLAGYLGIPLSVVTISGLPVLLGIGIDFAIQMHSRVEEEVQLDRAAHPIQETTTNLVPPLIIATFGGGHLVPRPAAGPGADDPRLRGAARHRHPGGAVADVVLTTAALGAREYRKPTPRARLHHRHDRPGHRQARVAPAAGRADHRCSASLVVFVGGGIVDPMLDLQTDPEEWVDQDSQVIADLDVLRDEVGSSSELGIFVQSDDVFSDETVELRARPRHRVARRARPAADGVEHRDDRQLPHRDPGHHRARRPRGPRDVANAYAVALDGRPGRPPVGASRRRAPSTSSSAPAPARSRIAPCGERHPRSIDSAERACPRPPPGLAVVGVGLLENLEANRMLLTYVALGAVFVFLMLRLRSADPGLLCMVPVLMGVGATSLVAFAAGFKLSPLTALGGPLVIAACTEFTSLILTRHMEERRRGLAPQEAADVASARTGRAFAASALATIAGVGVLVASPLPLLRDFGLITSVNVAVALLSALVILPPLMVWADDHGWVHPER